MTFNIRGGTWNWKVDGINAWPEREALNVCTIKRYAPDLIGFQEFEDVNLRAYQEHLPQYDHVMGPEYGSDRTRQHNSVFWDSARFEVIDSGGFWLSETPDQFSKSWESSVVRSVAWIKLRSKPSGLVLYHWNTHFDHISEPARVGAAKVVLGKVGEVQGGGVAIIITGDFNCLPDSDAYRQFRDYGFADTYVDAGHTDSDEVFTAHEFKGEDHQDPLRIDWILALGGAQRVVTTSSDIVRDHDGPVYPSDHYPVIADLQIAG